MVANATCLQVFVVTSVVRFVLETIVLSMNKEVLILILLKNVALHTSTGAEEFVAENLPRAQLLRLLREIHCTVRVFCNH